MVNHATEWLRAWRFCLFGGLALQRWGEPRETIDVDVTLLTGFGSEEAFVREILDWYEPRVAEPTGFALENGCCPCGGRPAWESISPWLGCPARSRPTPARHPMSPPREFNCKRRRPRI